LLPTFKTDTFLKSIQIILVGYVLSCLNVCGCRFRKLLLEMNRDLRVTWHSDSTEVLESRK
jgi:hypothetical protein